MARRVLMIAVALLLVAVGWVAATVVRSHRPWAPIAPTGPLVPSTGTSPAVLGATPNPSGQVEVTVSSSDVPGCIAEGQPFRAHVRSRRGDLGSDITLTYRWSRAPAGESILVQLEGNAHQAEVEQGKAFPNVNLRLPMDGQTVTVPLTTFVFKRLDESGRACFVWVQAPSVPRRYNAPRAAVAGGAVVVVAGAGPSGW